MSHRTGSWGAVLRQLWQLQKGSLSDGDCSEISPVPRPGPRARARGGHEDAELGSVLKDRGPGAAEASGCKESRAVRETETQRTDTVDSVGEGEGGANGERSMDKIKSLFY